jgi:predicted nuclease of predicted toxin-antitoxin system
LKLLIDNDLSPRIAHCLHSLFVDDHQIVSLREKFAQNTPDAEWMEALSLEGGWAVFRRAILTP